MRDYNLSLKLTDRILLMQKTRACTRTERERGVSVFTELCKIMTQLQGVYNLHYLVNTNSNSFHTAVRLVTYELDELDTSELLLIKALGDGLPDITKRAKQAL